VLGALLFIGYSLLHRSSAPKAGQIVVTPGKIANLRESFSRVWQRPPSASELDGLIEDYIREEVLAREAMALGLDRDDTVIRRRLRQKMEFLFNNRAAQAEPSDEQLRAWLSAYPDAFRVEPRFTFRQVYLNPQRRGAHLARDSAQLLAQLQHAGSQADVAALGDASLLEHAFEALPASAVAKQFGKQFTAQLGEVPTGQWHGPIASSYGAHLVFVSARTEGRLPALEDVRDAVRRDWANAQRHAANEQFYQALLQRYTVTIERPQPVQGAETPHGTEARR
jgi:hypothetical protein